MRSTGRILALLSLCFAGSGLAGPVPRDLEYCRMWSEIPAGTTGWLVNCPCGDGGRLDQMRNQTGDVVNGVIWVQLIDVNQNPMAGYPAEDVWLESHWESFTFAYLGSCPDGTSDAEGLMVWREPLVAGGVALHGLVALVGGQALNLPLLETVRFVSPDISGDMEVNLADLNMFSSDYVATYHERSDLVHDGAIDLADVSLLASHYGHGCP